MLAVPDFTRQLRTWIAQRAPARTPAWTVHEVVAGISASGDAEVAIVLEPPTGLQNPSVLLETWSAERRLEVREMRPDDAGDGRYVLFASYVRLSLASIERWRLGSPEGAYVEVRPGGSSARTKYVRVHNRTILVPGDPHQLALRGAKTLHHWDCHTLRWVRNSSLERGPDLRLAFAMRVHVCRSCVPRPPGE